MTEIEVKLLKDLYENLEYENRKLREENETLRNRVYDLLEKLEEFE
nr:MAG TPA: Initiation-control protein YabA, DnaA, DnaN, Zinc finger.7A [Caudoviricetes sp.]DAX62830.1 MAG TPA: Initiation-control protein YabA, DnaA, DnaN, Zinc finger.7A [Caudoviricetes sp.]